MIVALISLDWMSAALKETKIPSQILFVRMLLRMLGNAVPTPMPGAPLRIVKPEITLLRTFEL